MLDAASEGEERYPIAGNSSSKEIAEIIPLSLFLERGSILFIIFLSSSSSFSTVRNDISLRRKCLCPFCFFCKKKKKKNLSYISRIFAGKFVKNFFIDGACLRGEHFVNVSTMASFQEKLSVKLRKRFVFPISRIDR